MRKMAVLLVFVLLIPVGLVLTGCGDNNYLEALSTGNSNDSKMEQALEALDNGHFNKAISLLSGLSDSDAKRKYLSSAYLGRAGFDTLSLIAEIDKAQEAAKDGGGDVKSYLWSAAGAIFDDQLKDGLISSADVADKLLDLDNALSVLFFGKTGEDWYSLIGGGTPKTVGELTTDPFASLSNARLFQAGIASALRVLISVAQQMQYDDTSVVINPAAFLETYGGDLPMPEHIPEHLTEDLRILAAAIDRINTNGDNSLVDDFNRFLVEIGYADDQSVSPEELTAYLNSLAGTSEARK